MLKPGILGAILAIISASLFSIMSLLIRKGTKEGSIGEMLGVILLVNLLVYIPASIFLYPGYSFSLGPVLTFIASGILATLLFRLLFYSGIKKIGASRAVSIKTSTPIFATIIAVLFLNESLTLFHMLGIISVVFGILLISFEKEPLEELEKKGARKPFLYVLIGAFLLALEKPIAKLGLNRGIPPLLGLVIKAATAMVGVSIYLAFKGKSLVSALRSKERKWYFLAGIVNTIGLFLIYKALALSKVVVVVPIVNTVPLFTVALAYFFMPRLEKITWKVVLGAILVVLGAVSITAFM